MVMKSSKFCNNSWQPTKLDFQNVIVETGAVAVGGDIR